MKNIQFENNYVLKEEDIEKVKKGLIVLLKKELPKEAQNVEVITCILEKITNDIRFINLNL